MKKLFVTALLMSLLLLSISGCDLLPTPPDNSTQEDDKTPSSDTDATVLKFTIGDYLFEENNTERHLVKYTGTETALALPESCNGESYKISSTAFNSCNFIKSIVIPEAVEEIEFGALQPCTSLEEITIPYAGKSESTEAETHFGYIFGAKDHSENADFVPTTLSTITINGCEKINYAAFYGCTNIKNLTIAESVTTIDFNAFQGCNNIESLTLPFIGNKKDVLENSNLGHIFGSATNNSSVPKTLKSLTLTSSSFIGESALAYTHIESIKIPDTVTSIYKSAFESCRELKSIVIPITVASVGSLAFNMCYDIDIYFEAVKGNTDLAYQWNIKSGNNIHEVIWGYNNVTSNNEYDYVVRGENVILTKYKGNDTRVTVPTVIDGYKVINFARAFDENKKIACVTIPDIITEIPDYAFFSCSNLKEVNVASSLTHIGSCAFTNCTSLTYIPNLNNITYLGNYAFKNCTSLTDITLSNNIAYLGNGVFSDCSSITRVTIPKSITVISNSLFSGCTSLKEIQLHDNIAIIGRGAFYNCKSITEFVIPSSVTEIGMNAFNSCEGLSRIVIPKNVKTVGAAAFDYCGKITIYCEAESCPTGWNSRWQNSTKDVVWGYQG